MTAIGKFSISNLPAVYFDGEYRVLAYIPSTPESLVGFPQFTAAAPLDPSQWQEIDMSWYKPRILNQMSTSSCVGQCSCGAMELCWVQSGRKAIEFNPYFVYGLVNHGKDAGAMISDALRALQTTGICLQDDLPANVMFQNQFPQKAFENAKRFKLEMAYRCASFNEICSAISLGFITPLGIMVDQNFSRVDAQGVAPVYSGRGGGGHCATSTSLIMGPDIKQAKDVKVGDLVYGHDSKKHKVTEVFTRNFNGNLAVINTNHVKLAVTDEHPALVYRNGVKAWLPVGEVVPGDHLSAPKIGKAQWNYEQNDDHYLYKVQSVSLQRHSGIVYNYEVEDCHSYVVDGSIVHNCILGVGLKKSSQYGWMIKVKNSWGQKFGLQGYAYIHKGHFEFMPPDAFAVQSVTDDPQDNTEDVPVLN